MVAWQDTERKNFRSERKSTTVTVTCLINNNAVSVNLQLGATVDLLPTIANITGASLPSAVLDGLDLSPLLFHHLSVSEAESMYPNVTCSQSLQPAAKIIRITCSNSSVFSTVFP